MLHVPLVVYHEWRATGLEDHKFLNLRLILKVVTGTAVLHLVWLDPSLEKVVLLEKHHPKTDRQDKFVCFYSYGRLILRYIFKVNVKTVALTQRKRWM